MTEYLMPVLRGAGFSFLFPAALVLALWGLGGTLLRITRADGGRASPFLSFTAGLDLAAFLVLAGMALFPGPSAPENLAVLLFLLGLLCCFFARRPAFFSASFCRKDLVFLLPGAILLAYAGFTFTYPGGWDECVYQFAVPRRWAESGTLSVLSDIPYSGFPSLPQILYVPIYSAGGVMGIRLFTFFCQCILAAGTIPLFRGRRTEAALVLSVFLLAPVTVSGFLNSYAELFLSLNLLAGLRVSASSGDRRASLLAGFFAGAMAAVKLSGVLPAGCLFLWRLLRMPRGERLRGCLLFLAAGALFAFVFYARPMAETGNPCHPYLAGIFSPGHAAMSEYHHRLGSDRFGYDNAALGFLRSFADLSRPNSSKAFDGTFGLPFLLWIAALAGLLLRLLRHRHSRTWIPLLFFPLFLFYAGWYLSSPQTRFLVPGALLAVPACFFLLRILPRRRRFRFLCLLLLCALVSVPLKSFGYLGKNWRQAVSGSEQNQLDLLYGRTGDDYLPACAMLRGQNEGILLLLFEQRTLYMPSCARVGTPLFQDRYLTGGLSPDELYGEFVRSGVRTVYFRLPVNDPDLLPSMLKLYPVVRDSLFELAEQKKLIFLGRAGDTDAFLFSVNDKGKR